ncbi:hypothetical protein BU17DRAFT_83496 [Hysterangium stoloniferum]|nr:hypothetical protein BU17DRAFT_83496 [Hysterangium stoloniferum]
MDAPPSYVDSGLPQYSDPSGTPSPRISDSSVTSVPTPRSDYHYTNGRLTLNLGRRHPGLTRPTYGWNGLVEGYVQVKKNTKSVQSITVTIEGDMITGVSERGFLVDQTRTVILRMSHTLFQSPSSEGSCSGPSGLQISFSCPIPSYMTGGTLPLPPSIAVLYCGMSGHVIYSVKVEMIRKGRLKQNERLKTFFNYFPRTFAALPGSNFITDEIVGKHGYDDELIPWRTFDVAPKPPQGISPAMIPDLRVTFGLSHPMVYASNSPIPFQLDIESGICTTEAVSSLFSALSVELIRVVTISSGARWVSWEIIIGRDEVCRVDERGDGRTIFGNVICSQDGESSWLVAGLEVKYLVRLKLAPRSDVPSLSYQLPTYTHSVPVVMRTHQQTMAETEDASLPAMSRLLRPLGM